MATKYTFNVDPSKKIESVFSTDIEVQGKCIINYDHEFSVLVVEIYRYLKQLDQYVFVTRVIKNANATDEDCFKSVEEKITSKDEFPSYENLMCFNSTNYRLVITDWKEFAEIKVFLIKNCNNKKNDDKDLYFLEGTIVIGKINSNTNEHIVKVAINSDESITLLSTELPKSFVSFSEMDNEERTAIIRKGVSLINNEVLKLISCKSNEPSKENFLKRKEELIKESCELHEKIKKNTEDIKTLLKQMEELKRKEVPIKYISKINSDISVMEMSEPKEGVKMFAIIETIGIENLPLFEVTKTPIGSFLITNKNGNHSFEIQNSTINKVEAFPWKEDFPADKPQEEVFERIVEVFLSNRK